MSYCIGRICCRHSRLYSRWWGSCNIGLGRVCSRVSKDRRRWLMNRKSNGWRYIIDSWFLRCLELRWGLKCLSMSHRCCWRCSLCSSLCYRRNSCPGITPLGYSRPHSNCLMSKPYSMLTRYRPHMLSYCSWGREQRHLKHYTSSRHYHYCTVDSWPHYTQNTRPGTAYIRPYKSHSNC